MSAIETDWVEGILGQGTAIVGGASGEGPYCSLFLIHGIGQEDTVSQMRGWYVAPGTSDRVEFECEHPLGLTAFPELGDGRFDRGLAAGAAEVEVARYPTRAFDSLGLATLSPLDLAYDAHKGLLSTMVIDWSIGAPQATI